MTISSSKLVSNCFFRADGVFCQGGILCYSQEPKATVSVEGEPVSCPACEGKAVILTEQGKDVMLFLDTFARPRLREIVEEIYEERKRR